MDIIVLIMHCASIEHFIYFLRHFCHCVCANAQTRAHFNRNIPYIQFYRSHANQQVEYIERKQIEFRRLPKIKLNTCQHADGYR